MTIWKKIRAAVLRGRTRRKPAEKEQVVLTAVNAVSRSNEHESPSAPVLQPALELKLDREIDFSRNQDLEAYTENLNVPEETIEQWISAGLLFPDEIRNAERMIRIIRKRMPLP